MKYSIHKSRALCLYQVKISCPLVGKINDKVIVVFFFILSLLIHLLGFNVVPRYFSLFLDNPVTFCFSLEKQFSHTF